MTHSTKATTLSGWIETLDFLKEDLMEAFVRTAIENRGIMMSPRRGELVSTVLLTLLRDYLTQDGSEADLAQTAVQFAEQGMAFSTAAKLMQTIQKQSPQSLPTTDLTKIISFQYQFLEQFSNARELVQMRIQENSQMALQHALQQQIEQQRLSNIYEAQRNETLKAILQLNSQLATISNQNELIEKAVVGLCQALNLIEVSVYQKDASHNKWSLQHSSDNDAHIVNQQTILSSLKELSKSSSFDNWTFDLDSEQNASLIINPFTKGTQLYGALVVQARLGDSAKKEELFIQVQTFSQNLSALLLNIELLEETKQRAKEMEILYGRFVDDIWRDENVQLSANFAKGQLHVNQNPTTSKTSNAVALSIGKHTIGELNLPDTAQLSSEDQAILQTIIQEMGDALNNARLIQETRSYSNQLDVAANVSRIAATIFDRDQLIKQVVEIVKNEFGFYYVGLFLVEDDGKTAVLQAGTGEAGRIQLNQNHHHIIGGGSMIGAALQDGDPRVEQDVSLAKNFTPNEILPETQSELALPLIAREHAIGALTVQSIEKHAFTPTTVTVLQSMANQLAIAIENASLLTQTQLNLDKTNRLYESARQIGASTTQLQVFEQLIQFAGQSELANIIHIITESDHQPNQFRVVTRWHQTEANQPFIQTISQANSFIVENILNEELFYIRQDDIQNKFDAETKSKYEKQQIRNAIFIPIKNDEQLFGFVALLCTSNKLPDNQSLQPFLTLVDHASIILANQQLLDQSESIYKIGRNINQSLTRDDAIDITVREAGRYIGADQCRFVLYNKQTGTGKIVSSLYPIDDSLKTMPLIGDLILEKLVSQKSPLLITEDQKGIPKKVIQKHLTQFNAQATYCIPSANQQEIIGFLAIDLKNGNRPLRSSHLIFVQTIVEHLTTQIENLKLLDEALNRAQELITLNQIQSNISQVISVEVLAKTVYQQIQRLLDSTIFSIALFNSGNNTLTPVFTICHEQEKNPPDRIISENDPIYHLLKNDKHVFSNDTNALTQTEADYLNIECPKSAIWMPLIMPNGENAGYMTIQSYELLAYEENDQQLFRSIATQTSLALSNAQLFETIQAKNQQLLQLDQLKTQFLANMSHELRTPLNSIIGFSRVILKGIDGPITTEQEEDLSSIYSNGQHLLMLINEILDMAKIEAGKMTMTFDSVDVYQSAKIASSTVRALMNEESVKFIWDVPTDLPIITADPVRTRQILINLLSNAVKYTFEGAIRLSIRHDEEDFIHIMVADTGIGIAERDFDKLFTAFEQVDNSTTRTFGGTGLGLPITKWIVEMHQGVIWFDTELKKGTTFHVKLPIKQDSKKSIQVPFGGTHMALTSKPNNTPN